VVAGIPAGADGAAEIRRRIAVMPESPGLPDTDCDGRGMDLLMFTPHDFQKTFAGHGPGERRPAHPYRRGATRALESADHSRICRSVQRGCRAPLPGIPRPSTKGAVSG
jgi:hypothetical protein